MICEHGSLKRSCPHCEVRELYAELDAMEAENKRLRTGIRDIIDNYPPGIVKAKLRKLTEVAG